MKKTSKIFAVVLTVVMMISLFTGCVQQDSSTGNTSQSAPTDESQEAKSPEKEPAKPAEKVKLRIATMFGGTDPATEVFEQALVDFQNEHSNVEITNESMTSTGDEYRTKVKTDYAAGNEPEIVFFYTAADAVPLIEAGKVMSYDEMWKEYPEVGKDITEGIKNAMREADGKIYALPITGFYEGLFVNKEIFEKYQLDLPTDWAKLENAVKILSENGVVPFAGPLAQSHYLIEHFVYAAAGAEGHKDIFSNGVNLDWVEGFNYIKDFYDMNAFSKDALSMDIENAQNLFKQENAAMILEGSWFIGGLSDELKEKVSVMPMPSGPKGKKDPTSIVAGFSSGYYVSTSAYKDDKKRDIVMDLVSFLTSGNMIQEMATANGGVPAADASVPNLSAVAKEGHKMAAEAKALNMPIDSRLTPEAFNYIVNQGVPYIAAGQKTPEDVLTEVMKIQKGE